MPSVSPPKQERIANLDHPSNTDQFHLSGPSSQNYSGLTSNHLLEDPVLVTDHPASNGLDGFDFTDVPSDKSVLSGNAVQNQSMNGGYFELDVPSSGLDTLSPSPPSLYSHLSPSVATGYASDNAYGEASHHTTPSFNDDLVNVDFSAFPDLEDSRNIASPPGIQLQGFHTNNTLLSSEPLPSQSTSNGSYLISPVHTNTSSPVNKHQDHIMNNSNSRQHSEGPMEYTTASPGFSTIHAGVMQQTPALTGSSKSSSHDGNGRPHMPLTSPIVTVENYSRDESPAREPLYRSLSRRSRTSQRSATHLSARHPAEESSSEEDDDEYQAGKRSGYNPTSRNDAEIPSLNEQEEDRIVADKNAEVARWIATSEAGSEAGDPPSPHSAIPRRKSKKGRRRALSAGPPGYITAPIIRPDDSGIPGPGVFVEEESEEDEDEDELSSPSSEEVPIDEPTADITANEEAETQHDFFPTVQDEPFPTQFAFRLRPWADAPYDNYMPTNDRFQPATANQAAALWRRRAAEIDTSSRVATWGTRRLSDTDLERFVKEGGILKRLSISKEKQKPKHERKSSGIFNTFLTRVPSNRRRGSEKGSQSPVPPGGFPKRKDSEGGLVLPPRSPSFPISLTRRTSRYGAVGAVAAIAGQAAAVGSSGSLTAVTNIPQPTPWERGKEKGKQALKRARSKSDLTRKPSSDGLSGLLTTLGGPPVPNLASPAVEEPQSIAFPAPTSHPKENEGDEEEAEDENMEPGIKMEMNIKMVPIIPTAQGFLTHAQQLNPRLAPFLAERISHEQVGRYKRLVKAKIGHLNAVNSGNCHSTAKFCPAFGGEARVLQPKVSQRDSDNQLVGYQVSTNAGSDDEDPGSFGEGAVAPAQFPQGVPLPPTKRLPAEFECPLCFKVKTFHKPSDWTKHVHEDVQPFTCTWPRCAEPKSFKRKADWVRHENERHRQLEWWTCNMPECTHTCYRKDNFVQHLVREHKMPEPKVKATKGAGKATSGKGKAAKGVAEDDWAAGEDGAQKDIDQLWSRVEQCHKDTQKKPHDEPCKFCGNYSKTWKALTVHLARHMEQISLPVLSLVEERQVSADTLISPVGQPLASSISPISPQVSVKRENFHSPFNATTGLAIPQQRFQPAQSLSPQASINSDPYVTYTDAPGFQTISPVQHLSPQLQYPRVSQPQGLSVYGANFGPGVAGSTYQSFEPAQPRGNYMHSPNNTEYQGVSDPQFIGHQGGGQLVNEPSAVTNYPMSGGLQAAYQPQHEAFHGQSFTHNQNDPAIVPQPFDFGFQPGHQVPYTQAPDDQAQNFAANQHHPF